ncbi:hypothetical protein SDRG_12184 [Saprolegnia diclina VS20]|uniref:Glycoside hydrolase family 5 domain-containing protein n=1 Tax=Saprolegnia diclina (strain VS20) TaxID=1156394 RepID=T0Q691_SAPDV|nr:hypothetical protein SDRG_12184 [Saprolegnia diclina VS20]EQC30126.1 hypothetical protein SDRG_12184 [Saprolegnia diclina VS20]|eukprot:XP_008616469.1 hypothetical protein SDRG_12184 [Saprolegnia diclina VS20]
MLQVHRDYAMISTPQEGGRGSFSFSERGSFTSDAPPLRPSLIARDIQAIPEDDTKGSRRFKGRLRTWPGILLLLGIIGGAIATIVLMSASMGHEAKDRMHEMQKRIADAQAITDGVTSHDEERYLVEDDGQINNPRVYPPSGCQLPNYVSKNGRIVATAKNGTEVPLQIKGVNWFGMETGLEAPFGLFDNDKAGTTVYAIAQFLAKNKFNSVRIPLCVKNILNNKPHTSSVINRATNRALDLSSYLSLLQSVTTSLGYRQISIMLSMHTLDIRNEESDRHAHGRALLRQVLERPWH